MARIDGITVTAFQEHADHRGALCEVFRDSWPTGMRPVQWNLVASNADVLRGVHIHIRHSDYLMCIGGEMLLGLHDVRPDSPTHGQAEIITLRESEPLAVTIPPGVAHGFYFPASAKILYSVSHYWDQIDEIGCAWNDPQLGLEWPTRAPLLSQRDQTAGTFKEMVAVYLDGREKLKRGEL
jgi:dTDP-4-dehydrorhamnose 3,5-epimerase